MILIEGAIGENLKEVPNQLLLAPVIKHLTPDHHPKPPKCWPWAALNGSLQPQPRAPFVSVQGLRPAAPWGKSGRGRRLQVTPPLPPSASFLSCVLSVHLMAPITENPSCPLSRVFHRNPSPLSLGPSD